jgi:hypothetical protein
MHLQFAESSVCSLLAVMEWGGEYIWRMVEAESARYLSVVLMETSMKPRFF